MRRLELLAPARNADIGIAAIDCGADAVYIAADKFGARQAAGNAMDEIARLCAYARRFGARVFVTVNTILYESELKDAQRLIHAVAEAGASALIVQDMAIASMLRSGSLPDIPLHASTQCAIRTPEKAKFLESLGFSRLILERHLSIGQIAEIAGSVDCEIECFVHGALCVCYSGQCYLSEKLAGRSANRGACIQACRSRYDLADKDGNILVRDKALLSLKDLNLKNRLKELADAGVTSFKIEGRLKNMSYVQNAVRDYSLELDRIIAESGGRFARASFGRVTKGFVPDTGKTFNRGGTELFIDGIRGKWAAAETTGFMGEEIGTVTGLNHTHTAFTIVPPVKNATPPVLKNGDGLSFMTKNGRAAGFRADVCSGLSVKCKSVPDLYDGAKIFRNLDTAFEKEIAASPCKRLISVRISLSPDGILHAVSEDGRETSAALPKGAPADNRDRMKALLESQLAKNSGDYAFSASDIPDDCVLPLIPASAINAVRRELAAKLDELPCNAVPLYSAPMMSGGQDAPGRTLKRSAGTGSAEAAAYGDGTGSAESTEYSGTGTETAEKGGAAKASGAGNAGDMCSDYRANVSNSLSETLYESCGAGISEKAYELTHRKGAELMRSKYCIRHELGLCPKQRRGNDSPLFLLNNGRRLKIVFDCRSCEMSVTE